MFSLNRVHLIGYQTQPVTLRQTPQGTSVTDLNIVVPYTFESDAGQNIEGKSFHSVTLWSSMAEVASQFVRPGSQVFVSGRLQTDSWDDESSGEKRSKTKIVALDLIMLDPKDGQSELSPDAALTAGCLNQAFIIGNVTRDPEMRTTTSGQHVLTLGVATNERWRNKSTEESKERTEFHNVVIWRDLAEEVGKTVKKGQRVYVSGRVQTRSWETQAGAKRYTTEVIADTVKLLGVKSSVPIESTQSGTMEASQPKAAAGSVEGPEQGRGDPVAAATVPDINYKSEIKVEDLPF
jgi:single-strand DNA-binding protein